MFKFLVISAFGFVLISPSLVLGQGLQTPEFRIDDVYIPKYLPPHPLYHVKIFRDNLKLFLTFKKSQKANFHLDLANKRVLEIVGLGQRSGVSQVDNLLENYKKNWKSFFDLISKMKIDEFDLPSSKARRNFAKQKEILNFLATTSSQEINQKIKVTLVVQEEEFNRFFSEFQGIDQLEEFKQELL